MTVDDDSAPWTTRATAIVDVARSAAATGPPPRGLPYFGLDHRSPTPLELVEDLASRGIFRKYEHVLDLGGGLGATTRYMVSRLGCTATATARTADEAAAGRLLTTRAGLDWQVHHAVGEATALPFAEAAFTHVWLLEALPLLGQSRSVLAEAFRVLRPGGHFGLQELVLGDDPALGARGFVRVEVRRAELRAARFVDVVEREVRVALDAGTTQTHAAWTQLVRRLSTNDAYARDRAEGRSALAGDRLRVVQFTARRP